MQVIEQPPARAEKSPRTESWSSPSIYRHPGLASDAPGTGTRIRALVVDDELFARKGLCRLLKNEPDIEVVGTPASGREAVEAINRLFLFC